MKSGKVISTITLILFLTTCVAATVNTGLFVYPSLSRSLLMECGLLLLALVAFLHCLFARRVFSLHSSLFTKFIVLWMVYIVVHGRLSEVTEWYRTVYLCVTLLSIITLSHAVSAGQFTRRHIVSGLLLVAVAHVVAVFAQWLGFMDSENSLFPITGFNDNPNVTAIYLVGVMPLLFHRFTKREANRPHGVPSLRWRVLGGAFIFLAILLLRCRTAYIGMAVEICVFLSIKFSPTERKVEKLKSGKTEVSSKKELPLFNSSTFQFYKVCIVCGTIIIAAISVGKLYNMKRDSADGRLLIWRLSAQMIAEQPFGHGYGLFEKHYNLRQAEYFREHGGTETERRNAAFTCMAYNDYLEHGVDGGIIGMAFLIGFYALAIRRAYKQRDTAATAILAAFAVMSLMNFVTAGIQTWLLVICAVSMIQKPFPPPSPLGREPHSDNFCAMASSTLNRKIKLGFICVAVPSIAMGEALALFFTVSMVMSQITLKKLNDRLKDGEQIPDMEFAALQPHIRTSEAYWRIRAQNSMEQNDYATASVFARQSLRYTSSPESSLLLCQCCLKQAETDVAVSLLKETTYIQPSRLYPKLYLMRLYANIGDTVNALSQARDILRTEVKVKSNDAKLIRREAHEYIKSRQ